MLDAPLEFAFLNDSLRPFVALRNPNFFEAERIVLRFVAFLAKQVDGDSAQPGPKTRLESERINSAKGLDYRFLCEVVGFSGISGYLIHQIIKIFLMKAEYLIERIVPAVYSRFDQRSFFFFHSLCPNIYIRTVLKIVCLNRITKINSLVEVQIKKDRNSV